VQRRYFYFMFTNAHNIKIVNYFNKMGN